jgi:hypothetical protein
MQAGEELAKHVDNFHAIGMMAFTKGVVDYLAGQWKTALALFNQSETVFHDHCTGVAWELDTSRIFSLWSLTYLGQLSELTRRRDLLLKDAQERGDRYMVTNLSTYITAFVQVGADNPAAAREELREAIQQWSQQGFHVQHHNALLARVYIDLYCGEARSAWDYVSAQWPGYMNSLLLRVQQIRVDALLSRARSALAMARLVLDPNPYLTAAQRDARKLGRERVAWAEALSQLIRAGVATCRGDLGGARALLQAAVSGFEALDMRLWAAAARRRLGQLLGGSQGKELVDQADESMSQQQVRNPARWAAMLAPGFPE